MKKSKEKSKSAENALSEVKPEKNIQSDGIAEDLIRAFVQLGCAEGHLKTLIEKYNAQLENGTADDLDATAEKLNDMINELNTLSETRRGVMLRLFDMYKGDKDAWCLVKHLGIGTYNIFEAWQASDDDPELYTLYIDANKRFVKALSYMLGVEITECAACFADFLKGENHG